MSPHRRPTTTAAERYDQALAYGHHRHLPPDQRIPQPTAAWPSENVALLERYRTWLAAGGNSPYVIKTIYIPMAGHALGLALKPHPELDLDADLAPALDFVQAKTVGAEWLSICANSLARFRQFLRHERGYVQVTVRPINYAYYGAGLPDWLVREMTRYQHARQGQWRPARINEQLARFWGGHTRFWRWLCQQRPIAQLADVKRRDLLDYVDHRLAGGYAASGINQDLRYLRGFLLFLQENDYAVPQSLLRIPALKQPGPLPRFLTDEQVRLLRADFERRVTATTYPLAQRNALFDRAAFYLLWQAGLRLGEVEELRLADLDLPGRKLFVRYGKGRRDRTAYLTEATALALAAYLAVRGPGPTEHLFLYHNEPAKRDLIRNRIKYAGARVGVKVYPHRLRHTMATQLLNAGCRITSIQQLMGHRDLESTLIYARVYDQTVADDYYTAMTRIEARLQLASPDTAADVSADSFATLPPAVGAVLADLAAPELAPAHRLELVGRLRRLLAGSSEPVAAHLANGTRVELTPVCAGPPPAAPLDAPREIWYAPVSRRGG